MNERRQEVRFEEETPVRSLYEETSPYAAAVLGELPLILSGSHMLNYRVREHDVELVLTEWHLAPITYHQLHVTIVEDAKAYNIEQYQVGHLANVVPVERCTTDIENSCVRRQSESVLEPSHASLPKRYEDSAIESVDVHPSFSNMVKKRNPQDTCL
jgi:hypothetical protein